MIEPGSGACFFGETAHSILVFGEGAREKFQRDLALEHCVFGQVNFAHPAGTERGKNAITSEDAADSVLVLVFGE